MNNHWTFPLWETYWAFGDGSERREGVFYGFVLIPEGLVDEACHAVTQLKIKYGGTHEDPIHCRVLFSDDARAKSGWAHLSRTACAEMCSDLIERIDKLYPLYVLTHYPQSHFPRTFRLRGKNDAADVVHPVDSKWMMLWSYIQTAALFDPAIINSPLDPLEMPRPRSQPSFDVVIKRQEPGPRVSRLYLDREHTNIPWISRQFQWMTIAQLLTIETPRGSSHLPIFNGTEEKHPMIELADVFVYSVAREMAGAPSLVRGSKASVLVMIRGTPMDEWIVGR